MSKASPALPNPHSAESVPAPLGLIKRLGQAVLLPARVSAFEASYLRRMNQIALWFFYAHLPVFMLMAWGNETGVFSVTLLTLAVLTVPTLGYRAVESERSKSYVLAFTSMCLGAVLVHAGQGPVQIEMHFYFFSVLAMLALFANPMTVIVGAATVAVQHLALWYLAPASIFNYEAPLWVVLVHAVFVVLETIAACFIARNFFDNVIGLEQKVEERTAQLSERNREMQVVLDSIEQGIVTVDAGGALLPEHSSAIVRFFGEYTAGESFSDLLSRNCVLTANWFSMNWEAIEDDFLPLELAIDQLPARAKIDGRSYTFEYNPKLDEEGELTAVLIVVSDVTSDVAREEAEALQRELLSMLESAMQDPQGFATFHRESEALLAEVLQASHGASTLSERRALHTMKGNAAAFGLRSISTLCHDLETAWSEGFESKSLSTCQDLERRWSELGETASQLLGPLSGESLHLPVSDVESMLSAAIEDGATELAALLADALLVPTSPVLTRLEAQAHQISDQLARPGLRTTVNSHGVRIPRGELSPFWSALVHVVRNAIDHGIEGADERIDASKEASGELKIATELFDDVLVVTVADDGRGVNWEKVRAKAMKLGLAHETREDLNAAIFADEFSTRDEVTDLSGRGIGLAAIARAVEDLEGSIGIVSSDGQGTQMRFSIPLKQLSPIKA